MFKNSLKIRLVERSVLTQPSFDQLLSRAAAWAREPHQILFEEDDMSSQQTSLARLETVIESISDRNDRN